MIHPVKADWVFVCGMMRSGSTVLHAIAGLLVTTTKTGVGVHYAFANEGRFPGIFAKYDPQPGRKVIKTYGYDSLIERLFEEGRASGIYSFRDLHEMLVSWGRRKRLALDDPTWMADMVKRQIRHEQFWTRQEQMLIIPYAAVVNDLGGVIRAVGAFLDIAVDDDAVAVMVEHYNIDQMRQQLPPGHVHDGGTDWRQHVTEAQAAIIADVVAEHGAEAFSLD